MVILEEILFTFATHTLVSKLPWTGALSIWEYLAIEHLGSALKMTQHHYCYQPTFLVFDPQLGLKPEPLRLPV